MRGLLKAAGVFATLAATQVAAPDNAIAQALPSPFIAEGGLLRQDVGGNRAIPGYVAPGLELGAVRFRPELAMRVGYDSNVLNLSANTRADAALLVQPSLAVETTAGRHRFGLVADARVARFLDLSSENSETGGVAGNVLLEISPAAALAATFRAGRRLEPRGAGGDTIPQAGPPLYDEVAGALGVPLGAGRFRVVLSGAWLQRRYLPLEATGPDIDQSFRDQRSWQLVPRAELRLNPALTLFTAATYTQTKSLEPLGQLARDSTGWYASGGVSGDILPLLTGEVEMGWRNRDYRSVQFDDFDGLVARARLDWYPTALTSLSLRAGQDFENSGIIGVPGILVRQVEMEAFHELLRNLLLNARFGYRHDSFRELNASARTLEAAVRAEWRLSPNWAAAGRIGLRDRATSDSQSLAGFSGLQASIGLEARL